MPALGLALTWAGYWFLFYGLMLKRGGAVTLIQTAEPSQRDIVIGAWGGAAPVQGLAGGFAPIAISGGQAAIDQLHPPNAPATNPNIGRIQGQQP